MALWQKPGRFRRVCPLLTETKDGWRCGVDAERVRPFWGRAALYTAAAVLCLYLLGSVAAFSALRVTGYDVAYRTIVWPPHWRELRGSQEKLHLLRAQQAIKAGNYQSAIISLETVCRLNPHNYGAGLALANLYQLAGQPSDPLYLRLMHDVPEQRAMTGQAWGRALVAGGEFGQLKELAINMLSEDSGRREAWLHALLFATEQTHDAEVLRPLLPNDQGLPDWCVEIIGIEQQLMERHSVQALPRLLRVHSRLESPYLPYFQVDRLLRVGRPEEAAKLLEAYGNRLPADEAGFLRLRAFRALKWTSLLEPEYDALLSYPLTPRLVAMFCAALVEQPAPDLLARYLDRFAQHGPALNNETLPLYHATYLAAASGGATERAKALADQISRFTSSDARTLRGLGESLKPGAVTPQIGRILPLVPLPLEVVYAIHQRQSMSTAP
ncbi:MAG TPA: hypothetical protein VG734_22550 [Lacunisphaera sp.]|nr:hypothetical protein [Lacunisphaera sp.]